MKFFLMLSCVILFTTATYSQEFVREFPGKELASRITGEKFPNMDAVIILKDQSFQISSRHVEYREYALSGLATTFSKIMIVKLLTENGVKRYGTFEYTYDEKFGGELDNGFMVQARIQKENGDIITLPKEEIKTIVSRKNSDGDPIERKVMFKFPDLKVGDIIQYEYQFSDLFSSSNSGLFYYSDRDYVLFSNLYITLPAYVDITTASFPQEKIGQPKLVQVSKQLGAGETYYWSVRNLPAVYEEPYARPFEDVSYLTGFYVNGKFPIAADNWNHIAQGMQEDIFDEGDIDNSDIALLGFRPKEPNITLATVDSVYTSLRKYFTLEESNSIFPVYKKISKIFEKKKADASDLSYVMYLMLKGWGQNPKLALIRDRREGSYEESLPSLKWFDRLGVLVTVNGKERFYDFDRSLPTQYEFPWYLNPVNVAVMDGKICGPKVLSEFTNGERNVVSEAHSMTMSNELELRDSVRIAFTGSQAQKERSKFYASEPSEISRHFKNETERECLLKADTVLINNFQDEKEFRATICGQSSIKPEAIDSFLTFSLKNVSLKTFKESIFSVLRRSDLYFETPFQYKLSWEITIPEKYQLQSSDLKQKIDGPENCFTETRCEQTGNVVKISANFRVISALIRTDQYKSFMDFIEKSIAHLERNIILAQRTQGRL
jgi:hypothetical protein